MAATTKEQNFVCWLTMYYTAEYMDTLEGREKFACDCMKKFKAEPEDKIFIDMFIMEIYKGRGRYINPERRKEKYGIKPQTMTQFLTKH